MSQLFEQRQSLRRTKIVATLGPACDDPAILSEMFRYINVARLNFSHGTHAEHLVRLNRVREFNRKFNSNVAILADLQGPKIRIGHLDAPVPIKPGDIITLRTDILTLTDGAIPMQLETFAKDVKAGDPVLVEDGKVALRVISTDRNTTVQLEVIHGGFIAAKKGVNLPKTKINVPSITAKDYKDTDFAVEHGAEWIALSFVREASDIITLRNYIKARGGNAKIIAKIEKPEAIANLESIIAEADGIMVARGDLGVEIDLEDVPIEQKRIVRLCNAAAKPVIVATQVLDSMEKNPRPTRAEANDVANAVIDGSDAVMLSGETATGHFPLLTVQTMSKIIEKVEADIEAIYYRNMKVTEHEPNPLNANIIINACSLARHTNAAAIVGMTRSGYTAYQLSHCRPKAQIYVFTSDEKQLTTLNLLWGVTAFLYSGSKSTDDTLLEVQQILKRIGFLHTNDIVINTASLPLFNAGLTNMLKISVVE